MRRHTRQSHPASILLMALAWGLILAGSAAASDPPHWWPNFQNGCEDCHVLHNAPGMTLTAVQGNANLCMSCHNTSGFPTWDNTQQAVPGASGSSHNWSNTPVNPTYGASLPSDQRLLDRVTDSSGNTTTLNCSTCHNQHKQTNQPADPRAPAYQGVDSGEGRHFQRMPNDANQMCLNCHAARNLSSVGHGAYTGNDLSHPVTVTIPQADNAFFATPLEPDGVTVQTSLEWGSASGGSTTTLDDSSKAWPQGGLINRWVRFTSGANVGLIRQISGNTATQISFAALPTTVTTGDTYEIDADGNFSNYLMLSPSGQVLCTSCHAPHYADSSSATYDDRPRTGDGMLLRRDNDASLCQGCHDLPIHNSTELGTKYGTWGTNWDCYQCHKPHSTANIELVNEAITTPNSGTKSVDFRYMDAGLRSYGLADTVNSGSGPCEVCHTKTVNEDGSARFRNTGGGAGGKHCPDTYVCVDCHTHKNAFKAGESEGGVSCACCHNEIWTRMNGSVNTNPNGDTISSRHSLGATHDINDSPDHTNPDATWIEPLNSVAAANRSCTNMCHSDHPHSKGAITTHQNNVYQDASSAAARSAAGATMNSDFESTYASGGLCLSCHDKSVSINGDVHLPLSKAKYSGAAHDYPNGTYTIHDGSTFSRNCTKCHADSADQWPSDSSKPFGAAHYSGYDSLLFKDPLANNTTTSFICYQCHGSGAAKDLESVFGSNNGGGPSGGRTYTHPITTDTQHDSITEAASLWNDGTFSGANRHVNCLDCHNPHEAGNTLHTQGSSTIGADSPIKGASGLKFTSPATAWSATTSSNFTWTNSASYEYEICFKCHSSYAWGATPPTGLTDQSREFSTANRRHWVTGEVSSGGGPSSTTTTTTLPPTIDVDLLYFTSAAVSEPAPNSHQMGDTFSGGTWGSASMAQSTGNNRVEYKTRAFKNSTRRYQARTFVSPSLVAQTISAGTWQFKIYAEEKRKELNAHLRLMVYLWRADDTIGTVIFGPTTNSTEISNKGQVFTWSFSTGAIVVANNERLIVDLELETWNATRSDDMKLRWNDQVNTGEYGLINPPGLITIPDTGGGGGGGGSCYGVFVNGWACGDYMTCSDCHGSDTAGDAVGPHGSDTAGIFSNGILKAPWASNTGRSGTSNHLCFNCHDWNTYSLNAVDGNNTGFAEQGGSKNLHREHMKEGLGCPQCHGRIPHGWPYSYPVFTKDDTTVDLVYRTGVDLDKDDIPNWGPSTDWIKNDCVNAHNVCK